MKFIEVDKNYNNNVVKKELDETEQFEIELLKELFSFCVPYFECDCFRCNFHEVIKYMDNKRKKHFILLLTKCFFLDGENNIYYTDIGILKGVLCDKSVKFLKQHKLSKYAPYQEFHKSKNKIVYKNKNNQGFIICEF